MVERGNKKNRLVPRAKTGMNDLKFFDTIELHNIVGAINCYDYSNLVTPFKVCSPGSASAAIAAICIGSLFRRKGFTSRCRRAQPKYFRQAISRQLQGNYRVKIEEQGEPHLVFLITWIRSTVVGIKVT